MKTVLKTILLTAALTTLWGCASDDKEKYDSNVTFSVADKPSWMVDLTGNEERPDWTTPDPAAYECEMFVLVRLQDELIATSSDDDCMAVFIDGQCRGLTQVRNAAKGGAYYFLLKVNGNNEDLQASLTLSYYSAQLKQVFTLSGIDSFVPERTVGFKEDYVPALIDGCSKYPIQRKLTVTLKPSAPFNVMSDDQVAVFAGDECRGAGQVGTTFTIFAREEGELMQIRYYSAYKGGIYTYTGTISAAQQQISYQIE